MKKKSVNIIHCFVFAGGPSVIKPDPIPTQSQCTGGIDFTGYCDGDLNTAECNFDEGECCLKDKQTRYSYIYIDEPDFGIVSFYSIQMNSKSITFKYLQIHVLEVNVIVCQNGNSLEVF